MIIQYFHDLAAGNLEGATLVSTILGVASLWFILVLWVRFVIFKWVLRIEGREFHRGWNQAEEEPSEIIVENSKEYSHRPLITILIVIIIALVTWIWFQIPQHHEVIRNSPITYNSPKIVIPVPAPTFVKPIEVPHNELRFRPLPDDHKIHPVCTEINGQRNCVVPPRRG